MIDNSKEYILCAASWYNNGIENFCSGAKNIDEGFVLCGYRHHNIIRVAPENSSFEGGLIHFNEPVSVVQGFLTSCGRFVEREDARFIACQAGQCDKKEGILFSEDLY